MSTFGYHPGQIDYWLFLTDWRNGSVAILLALVVGALAFIFASSRKPGRLQPDNPLPTHASPGISESAGDEASSALPCLAHEPKQRSTHRD
jgi:hypothetical protein